jgi:hypothetical protein
MKNYLTEWKKFKNKILSENVETAVQKLNQAKKNVNIVNQNADMQKQMATAALKTAEEELEIAKAQEAAEQATGVVKTGTTTTTGTTATVKEESVMSVGGRQDGATGKQPVSVQEDEQLTEEEMEEASGCHEGMEEGGSSCQLELEYQDMDEEKACNECAYCRTGNLLTEAKYKGRTVPLGKPMRGDVKKFKVFVRDPKTGNVKKVNFGDKKMRIKKSNPKRRKSFRARHNCANPGPRTKARYWSCRKW